MVVVYVQCALVWDGCMDLEVCFWMCVCLGKCIPSPPSDKGSVKPVDTVASKKPLTDLLNLFSKCTFLLYGNFVAADRRLIRRYITAYDGWVIFPTVVQLINTGAPYKTADLAECDSQRMSWCMTHFGIWLVNPWPGNHNWLLHLHNSGRDLKSG